MEIGTFMDYVIKKRSGPLNGRLLTDNWVLYFLAGMCCAMDAIETEGGDCCDWIPVSGYLPQEQADSDHPDGFSYEVSIQKCDEYLGRREFYSPTLTTCSTR